MFPNDEDLAILLEKNVEEGSCSGITINYNT